MTEFLFFLNFAQAYLLFWTGSLQIFVCFFSGFLVCISPFVKKLMEDGGCDAVLGCCSSDSIMIAFSMGIRAT